MTFPMPEPKNVGELLSLWGTTVADDCDEVSVGAVRKAYEGDLAQLRKAACALPPFSPDAIVRYVDTHYIHGDMCDTLAFPLLRPKHAADMVQALEKAGYEAHVWGLEDAVECAHGAGVGWPDNVGNGPELIVRQPREKR